MAGNPLERKRDLKLQQGDSHSAAGLAEAFTSEIEKAGITEINRSQLLSAPDEWNFYAPMPEDKMLELMSSIEDQGLMHPVVVWQQKDGKYMILSGHNRNKAYQKLYEYYQEKNPEKAAKYSIIQAHVFPYNKLTEEDAKQIIIDTNWVSRILSPMEKHKSIYNKYISIKRSKDGEGLARDIIAKDLAIGGRQVSNYLKLKDLSPEFQDMVDDGSLSLKCAVEISKFDSEIQAYIYDKYNDRMDIGILKQLKIGMATNDIDTVFKRAAEANNSKACFMTKSIPIPENLKNEYLKCMTEFLKANNLWAPADKPEKLIKK